MKYYFFDDATQAHLRIYRGADFHLAIELPADQDWAGLAPLIQFRAGAGSALLFQATADNGFATQDGVNVSIDIPGAETNLFGWDHAYFDVFMLSDDHRDLVARGRVSVYDPVTDPADLVEYDWPDGASAYQIWLAEDNSGTPADFLASLVGPPGSDGLVNLPAAVALGGHRLIAINDTYEAVYADNTIPSLFDRTIGVSLGAVSAGQDVSIQGTGEITEASWSWQPGALYLGSNGQITQTPPSSGTLLVVGTALTATRILLEIQPPIELI